MAYYEMERNFVSGTFLHGNRVLQKNIARVWIAIEKF